MDQDFVQLDFRRNGSTIWFGKPVLRDQFGGLIDLDDAEALFCGKRVIVFFHGFNVEEPLNSAAQLAMALRGRFEVFVVIRWPGSQIRPAFWLACRRAAKAGILAAKTLGKLLRGVKFSAFIGHSLGCRVLLQALKSGLHCDAAILAAAAVDDESLEPDSEFGSAPDRAKKILVAYSRNDGVLAKAYWLAKLDRALGSVGPQRKERVQGELFTADLTEQIDGHSEYVRCAEFVKWVRLLTA